ncbi:MAG: hypothetical protein A2452_11120 [Candidatus Firestonebacteria bacterium RIFOXYC2_FULL_39_67]|nr:MAG: hypothetical protein A2452_11120 [Candidatus Firestonebacteria bacterium RIFOXYC2_FULL_39_67]
MYIENLITKYLEEFEKRSKRDKDYVSQNTIKAYNINLQKFLIFLKENKYETNVKKIKEDCINRYINELVDKKLSPASRNQRISTLKSFFKWARKYYDIKNPMVEIRCAYQPRKEASFISKEDCIKILTHIDKVGGINQVLFRTLLQSGMRASEIIGLDIPDITFEKDGMFIRVLKGKGNKQRILPFRTTNSDSSENRENLKLYNLLKTYIRNRKKQEVDDKNALFISTHGRRITYTGLNKKLSRLLKKVTLQHKKYSLHTFRHTRGKILMENGARIKILQKFLGHEDPVTTIRIYDHTSIEEISNANKF